MVVTTTAGGKWDAWTRARSVGHMIGSIPQGVPDRTPGMTAPVATPATHVTPHVHAAPFDALADEWWRPRGVFAVLHWLAAARAARIPPAARDGALLLDVACGGGLLAPHVAHLGYRHVGVDLSVHGPAVARAHGVEAVRGDALRLPVADATADVVVAGELLEHVPDLPQAVAELCRVLRPGGLLLADTLARTWLTRLTVVELAERLPTGVPRGLHPPELLVDRAQLVREAARHGVPLSLIGLRPSLRDVARYLARRSDDARFVPTRFTTVLFLAHGRKEAA